MMAFALEHGLDTSVIPEPSALSLLAAGAGLLVRRRRNRVA